MRKILCKVLTGRLEFQLICAADNVVTSVGMLLVSSVIASSVRKISSSFNRAHSVNKLVSFCPDMLR